MSTMCNKLDNTHNNLKYRYYYPLTDEEVEAQRDKVTCLMANS